MRIAVIGGTGMIGAPIVAEAVARGHEVTVVSRSADPAGVPAGVAVRRADALDPEAVARAVAGDELVIAAASARRAPLSADDVPAEPDPDEDWSIVPRIARSLLDALPVSGVQRLLWVSGSGSLEVSPGVTIIDTPEFGVWPEANAHRDALDLLRSADTPIEWTAFSAPHDFAFGPRGTGRILVAAGDSVLRNSRGESRGTIGDAAHALLDEAEQRRYPRRRFTMTVEP